MRYTTKYFCELRNAFFASLRSVARNKIRTCIRGADRSTYESLRNLEHCFLAEKRRLLAAATARLPVPSRRVPLKMVAGDVLEKLCEVWESGNLGVWAGRGYGGGRGEARPGPRATSRPCSRLVWSVAGPLMLAANSLESRIRERAGLSTLARTPPSQPKTGSSMRCRSDMSKKSSTSHHMSNNRRRYVAKING